MTGQDLVLLGSLTVVMFTGFFIGMAYSWFSKKAMDQEKAELGGS